MSDKAYNKAHGKLVGRSTETGSFVRYSAQFMQLQKYNSVVAGLHEYYCVATEVSHDFGRLAFSINKQAQKQTER